ncbi:MAG: ABC transporter substrate-binding protein [Proteobacteria bacterium]|nr:ABC transporter substrate-binding protein [Pseudomonadota bacterium]
MKKVWVFLIAALLITGLAMGPRPALAEDKVFYVGSPMDFTKIYTFLSRIWEQGIKDYFTLINDRGGVKGYRIENLIADHANEPQRGIELYEQMKKKGAMVIDTFSTPVAHAILTRCMKDKVVLLTPMHGRGDAMLGEVFPWVFPMGATYWSKSAAIVEYIYMQEKENLKGKKIAFIHIDTPFGREVLPVVNRLKEKLGFELGVFGYPPPGNEQAALWTQVRRFGPDWVILWSAGIGQSVSVKEAIRNGIPVDRITSCDWLLEPGMQLVGPDRAKGVVRVEGVAPGRDYPIIQEILTEVYAKGKSKGDPKFVGSTLYNVAVGLSMLTPEVVRLAVENFGEPLDSDKVRRAFEMFKDFNCGGMTAPITTSPQDHEGGGGCRLAKWDGKQFVPITGWFSSRFRPEVLAVAKESAAKFKAEGK